MRVFLVGFMAAGKSTVGRHLAARLGWNFLDLDRRVERMASQPLARLFEDLGEEAFRARETMALRESCSAPRIVVATGGGAFSRPENRELIARHGTSVFLDPPFELIWKRLEKSPVERPLLSSREKTEDLWSRRRDDYLRADLRVEVGDEGEPEEVAAKIIDALRENPCAT